MWARRLTIFSTFVFSVVGIACISVAMGTSHWIYAAPILTNNSELDISMHSYIYFGAFSGQRGFDRGLGMRKADFSVIDEIHQKQYLSFALWVSCIFFAGCSLLWGVVSAVFAIVNSIMTPVQTLTGLVGLYVWNALATFSAFTCAMLFVIQFYAHIKKELLSSSDRAQGWDISGRIWFDYSFWLLLLAIGMHALNILLLLFLGLEVRPYLYRCRREKESQIADGSIFLY